MSINSHRLILKPTLQVDCIGLYLKFEMLKAVVYILSVYLFFLCSFPCAEEDCDHEEGQTELAVHSDEESNEQDACTPFCIDKCCIGHVICQPNQDIVLKSFSPRNIIKVSLKEIVPSQRLHSIWQPPRA